MQWYVRAFVVLGVCLMFCVPWLSIGLAGLFSAVFRFRLNRLRGLDWRYVSPSNWYDFAFIWACWYSEGHAMPTQRLKRMAEIFHRNIYAEVDFMNLYRPAIHRAGTIAYITEGLVFAGALAWHLI